MLKSTSTRLAALEALEAAQRSADRWLWCVVQMRPAEYVDFVDDQADPDVHAELWQHYGFDQIADADRVSVTLTTIAAPLPWDSLTIARDMTPDHYGYRFDAWPAGWPTAPAPGEWRWHGAVGQETDQLLVVRRRERAAYREQRP